MKFIIFLVISIFFPLTLAKWQYGLDFVAPGGFSSSDVDCLYKLQYRYLIPRIWRPDGQVDQAGIQALKVSHESSHLELDLSGYITPQVGKGNGPEQVDKIQQALLDSGFYGQDFYIQVTKSSASWTNDTTSNINFINSMISRANDLGLAFNILTSFSDWVSITGNSKTIAGALLGQTYLWYSKVHGPGVTGESQPDYRDFVAFGPWSSRNISMKQFATSETLCGMTVNRNAFLID